MFLAPGYASARWGLGVSYTKQKLYPEAIAELKKQKAHAFPIRPIVTDEIHYMPADEEEEHVVAQANAPIDGRGNSASSMVLGFLSTAARTMPGWWRVNTCAA